MTAIDYSLRHRVAALEAGGMPVVRAFPFAYNTPDLLTGAALYTPTAGDVLLNAWINVETIWDGTTPRGDFGTASYFSFNDAGWLGNLWIPENMHVPTTTLGGVHWTLVQQEAKNEVASGFPNRVTGTPLAADDPINVVVFQEGSRDVDPGSSQGAAVLYLITATPRKN